MNTSTTTMTKRNATKLAVKPNNEVMSRTELETKSIAKSANSAGILLTRSRVLARTPEFAQYITSQLSRDLA